MPPASELAPALTGCNGYVAVGFDVGVLDADVVGAAGGVVVVVLVAVGEVVDGAGEGLGEGDDGAGEGLGDGDGFAALAASPAQLTRVSATATASTTRRNRIPVSSH